MPWPFSRPRMVATSINFFLDLLGNFICLLKLPFLASLSQNFLTICLHNLSFGFISLKFREIFSMIFAIFSRRKWLSPFSRKKAQKAREENLNCRRETQNSGYICSQNLSINLLKKYQFFQAKLIPKRSICPSSCGLCP